MEEEDSSACQKYRRENLYEGIYRESNYDCSWLVDSLLKNNDNYSCQSHDSAVDHLFVTHRSA